MEKWILLTVVITAPRGSSCELKFAMAIRDFLPGKMLPKGMVYPFDYRFIPSTETANDASLEVTVFVEEPSMIGSIVPARAVGVIRSEEEEDGRSVRKNRLVAVLATLYKPSRLHALDEPGSQLISTIEEFFARRNSPDGGPFRGVGHGGPEEANAVGRVEPRVPAWTFNLAAITMEA
jgi:inorganic pyrophosphatase